MLGAVEAVLGTTVNHSTYIVLSSMRYKSRLNKPVSFAWKHKVTRRALRWGFVVNTTPTTRSFGIRSPIKSDHFGRSEIEPPNTALSVLRF